MRGTRKPVVVEGCLVKLRLSPELMSKFLHWAFENEIYGDGSSVTGATDDPDVRCHVCFYLKDAAASIQLWLVNNVGRRGRDWYLK
jgi:hypothetical protein